VSQGPDLQWCIRDLREQLGGAVETLTKLRDKCELVKNRLLFFVDQGEGLTQDQLVEVYTEINKLFPKRVRKQSTGTLDAQL
jgi:hypothetical protein